MKHHPGGLLRLIPIVLCPLLCSCASTMTWNSLGRETFVWKPSRIEVSVRTEQTGLIPERQTVSVRKKGETFRCLVPYDFTGKFPCREESVQTEEYETAGNLPLIPVRVIPGTKNIGVFTEDAPFPQFTDSGLNCGFAGFPDSVHAATVSPDDFAKLRKPFLFRHFGEWFLCVPGTPLNSGDMLSIPVAKIGLGTEMLSEERRQKRLMTGAGITLWRILWLPLPVVLDIAAFPVQLFMTVFPR